MEQYAPPVVLNVGCGEKKFIGAINVDAYGNPDVKHDLNVVPWPFEDDSVDEILAFHIFEHLHNWWGAFTECARILKPGGTLQMRVPDESSSTALSYRDHLRVFTYLSFFGIQGMRAPGTNAWASEQPPVPFEMVRHDLVPFTQYQWISHFPWLAEFLAKHMRNFIHEQRFLFRKLPQEQESTQ